MHGNHETTSQEMHEKDIKKQIHKGIMSTLAIPGVPAETTASNSSSQSTHNMNMTMTATTVPTKIAKQPNQSNASW